MKVRYLGHSGVQIDDLVIDPFLTGNSFAKEKPEAIKCKYVLITHDHPDHVGDAFDIARRNGATIVAIHELAVRAQEQGCKAQGMNIGGTMILGDWTIRMEMAFHSAGVGASASFIIGKSGKTIYHAGDTCLFLDMQRFREYHIDLAFIPIGDRYTMGPQDAARSCEMIGCKKAVPIHYRTFPMLLQTAGGFKKQCPCECVVMEPGDDMAL
jgi:L-ascorbate metabolism protein UlaG (beta-lactamase superfamily)